MVRRLVLVRSVPPDRVRSTQTTDVVLPLVDVDRAHDDDLADPSATRVKKCDNRVIRGWKDLDSPLEHAPRDRLAGLAFLRTRAVLFQRLNGFQVLIGTALDVSLGFKPFPDAAEFRDGLIDVPARQSEIDQILAEGLDGLRIELPRIIDARKISHPFQRFSQVEVFARIFVVDPGVCKISLSGLGHQRHRATSGSCSLPSAMGSVFS